MKMENRIMHRFASAAILLASLAACGPVNNSFDTVKAPVVTTTQMVFDVPAYSSGLGGSGAQALEDWFGSIRLGYGDRVTVDDPNAMGATARRAEIAQLVGRYGLLLSDTAPITRGTVPDGSVRIIVSRSTARVDNCPDWSRASHPELSASSMSNFGCATESNLAAMIADPNDLVAGKPYAGSDANTAVKAVDAWRKAQPTGVEGLKTDDISQQKGSK